MVVAEEPVATAVQLLAKHPAVVQPQNKS